MAKTMGQPLPPEALTDRDLSKIRAEHAADGPVPEFPDGAEFIRAYFDYGRRHPLGQPGHRSTTVLQPIRRFLELYDAGAFRSYWDVATLGVLAGAD